MVEIEEFEEVRAPSPGRVELEVRILLVQAALQALESGRRGGDFARVATDFVAVRGAIDRAAALLRDDELRPLKDGLTVSSYVFSNSDLERIFF